MKIKHEPMFDIEKVEKMYSEKDGVPVKYVMTSELPNIDTPMDIFYRDTPHPEFGNRYFGIFSARGGNTYIISADAIDGCLIVTVKDDNGKCQYSAYRHDYKSFNNGNMIDGGRGYARYNCQTFVFKVTDGELIEVV
jgi:hypothetical protein